MIESILFAALGFLGAVLLALLAAPVLWRRAAALARQRVEASIPISRSEIQADKDRLRADFAMAARRLEMNIGALRDKTISQSIELDRQRDRARELAAERASGDERISVLEAEAVERQASLDRRGEELEAASARFDDISARMETMARELEEMNRIYEEASYSSSERQIALVAREAEIDRLSDELAALRRQRKEEERRMKEADAARKESEDGRDSERRRAEELDARLSRLIAASSDSEERLERREKEMARLQQEAKSQAERAEALARDLDAGRARVAWLEDALERSAAGIAALERHEKEVVRLQRDLLTQTRRADGLALQVEAHRAAQGASGEDAPTPVEARHALLREQINELAAQVVQLTALAESPESPLRRQLANGGNGAGATSIADRVRALQNAAASEVN